MNKQKWLIVPMILMMVSFACVNPGIDRETRLERTITYGNSTPVANIDAVDVIQTYASDVLGLALPDLRASGRAGEITLPVKTREGVDVAIDLAGTTYFGLWREGFASLSVGDSTVSGDWDTDVEDGSLGAFVLRENQALPEDAVTALELLLTIYPGLNGYEFVEIQDDKVDKQGFEFRTDKIDNIRIQTWEVTLQGTMITAGISPGLRDDRSVVWVVIASGALASPFTGK